MIIAETILAVSIICSVPKKRQDGQPLLVTYDSYSRNTFQISSGISWERKLMIDLKDIDGVETVSIAQNGNVVEVTVVLDRLDFSSFQKVTRKEMELFDQFPGLRFEFNVLPAAAMKLDSLLDNAA